MDWLKKIQIWYHHHPDDAGREKGHHVCAETEAQMTFLVVAQGVSIYADEF
jgi:hypothetical protein